MRVLIAFERSGKVRRAFRRRGHDAWSCDIEAADDGDPHHLQMDAVLAAYSHGPWDLMIAHPVCTNVCNSSAKHLYVGKKKENGAEPDRWAKLGGGAQTFLIMQRAPIRRKALENPIMLGHVRRLFPEIRRPTQIIQPWQFGDWETNATGLWLEGLMPLRPIFPTLDDYRRAHGLPADAKPKASVHKMSPGPDRARKRSETFDGIAEAFAEHWGGLAERIAA